MKALYYTLHWPKVDYSGFNNRTIGLIERLILNSITTSCVAGQSPKKEMILREYQEIQCFQGDPENTTQMSLVFDRIDPPNIAIYDSQQAEEKYSHYTKTRYPNCMQILLLQNLGSLRYKRENYIKQNPNRFQAQLRVELNADDPLFYKEALSLIRSDMVIITSDYEKYILENCFKVDPQKIVLLTNFYNNQKSHSEYEKEQIKMQKEFDRRKDFVFLGNMNSNINKDTVEILTKKIWPRVKEQLPEANLYLYGKDMAEKSFNSEGIFYCGEMEYLSSLTRYRLMLCPTRYAAGIRSKIMDAWSYHLPVVTTPIGAEGLFMESTEALELLATDFQRDVKYFKDISIDKLDPKIYNLGKYYQDRAQEWFNDPETSLKFGGSYQNFNEEEYIDSIIHLYQNRQAWEQAVENSELIMKHRADKIINENLLMRKLNDIYGSYLERRQHNLVQKETWKECLQNNTINQKFLREQRTRRK